MRVHVGLSLGCGSNQELMDFLYEPVDHSIAAWALDPTTVRCAQKMSTLSTVADFRIHFASNLMRSEQLVDTLSVLAEFSGLPSGVLGICTVNGLHT